MAKRNPIVKAWKYMSAWLGAKVDEKADPKIQIEQAIQDAQQQHAALTQQAAAVIGNQRQLEMQLDRQIGTVENLKTQTQQALVLADKAREDGDADKATQFDDTAQALANQLVSAEASLTDLKTLHDQALQAAQQARDSVQNNEQLLRQKLAERSKLLSQLEQAKMQEQVASSLAQMNATAAPSNVPTLDEVRDKIERRYAIALGQTDIAQNSVGGRIAEVQRASLDMRGAARLEEIRASMTADAPKPISTKKPAPAIENAPAAADPSTASQPATEAEPTT
jgi:phage shock protein A